MTKTYGQFCGLARALEHVGDRWTLLVIRELLLAEASYGELLAALDGVPTNLLAARLRQLEVDGLVTRERDAVDRRRASYQLTPLGAELEPALLALIRWGTHWMRTGPGQDRFEPNWAVLALRALLGGRAADRAGIVEVHVHDVRLHVISALGADLRVVAGMDTDSGTVVNATPELLLGIASGQLTMTEALRRGVQIRGDRSLACALLQPRPARGVVRDATFSD